MLRIAVPNKGSLSDSAADMLRECGYRQRRDNRELVLADPDNDAEFFFLRPRDIAVYVGSGTLDVGITGRDMLLDSGADATETLALGFGRSTFRFAARPGEIEDTADLAGRRIATSYPGLVEHHLQQLGLTADIVRLAGAVESAVSLGVADAIADVVETGTTLRAAGLATFGAPILESEAVLIRRTPAAGAGSAAGDQPGDESGGGSAAADVLSRRLQGVLVARRYVMMDYDVRVELAERACALTPGLESPTLSPLQDKDWVAVRAMVPRSTTNRIMDELWDLGARAILVTDIHACRL